MSGRAGPSPGAAEPTGGRRRFASTEEGRPWRAAPRGFLCPSGMEVSPKGVADERAVVQAPVVGIGGTRRLDGSARCITSHRHHGRASTGACGKAGRGVRPTRRRPDRAWSGGAGLEIAGHDRMPVERLTGRPFRIRLTRRRAGGPTRPGCRGRRSTRKPTRRGVPAGSRPPSSLPVPRGGTSRSRPTCAAPRAGRGGAGKPRFPAAAPRSRPASRPCRGPPPLHGGFLARSGRLPRRRAPGGGSAGALAGPRRGRSAALCRRQHGRFARRDPRRPVRHLAQGLAEDGLKAVAVPIGKRKVARSRGRWRRKPAEPASVALEPTGRALDILSAGGPVPPPRPRRAA